MWEEMTNFQIKDFTSHFQKHCSGRKPNQFIALPHRTFVVFSVVIVLFMILDNGTSFCNAEEYFLDEDEHSTSLEGSKVPKIPPEIRVLAKHGEFHKTIYDLPNTETVLTATNFQLDIYDFAHWNDTHHSNGWERSHSGKIDPEEYHPANTTNIYLECTSFYPVEWVYEGDGWDIGRGIRTDRILNAHKIRSRGLRVTEEFKNKTTNLYFAQIGFLKLYEVGTGNYTCRSLVNPRLASYFYLYMPVNSRPLDGEIIPETKFLLDAQQIVRYPDNLIFNDFIRLPCSVSDPSTTVTLLKRGRDGKFLEVSKNNSIVYLPSKGFLINLKEIKSPWGIYICREETTKNTLQVLLLQPKDNEVRAFPNETKVHLNPSALNDGRPSDVFECHAKRKIVISFDFDTKDVPVKIDYKFDGTDEFPYKAVATVPIQSQRQLKKDWAIVRCQTADLLRTLHFWEYSPKVSSAPSSLEIHYDSFNHQYLCCASNSIHQPKFQMVFCGDDLECRIRKGFYVTNQNAYSTKHFAPEGCSSIPVNVDGFGEIRRAISKWPAPVVEGLLQCSIGFPGFEEKKELSFVHNELTGFIHMSDTKEEVALDEIPAGQTIMGIKQDGALHDQLVGNIYVGDHIKFHCYAPSKYFSVGPTFFVTEAAHPPPFYIYQWAIMKRNGHIKYISSESCFFDTCEITLGDKDTVGVVCFAPIRNSFNDVRNFTLPINVKERPKIIQTNVAIRSPFGIERFLTNTHNASVILNEKTLGRDFKHGENSILLICSAPYHIQWQYSGSGKPFVSSHNRRDALSIKVVYSYNYTSVLEFKKIDEMITGRYTCFGTEDPRGLNSFYDVYVPGVELFMTQASKLVHIYGEQDEEKVESVNIPCAVSDPTAKVSLYTVHPSNNSWVPALVNPGLSYDPLHGFRQRNGQLGDLLGYYYCGDSLGRTSGLITIENGRNIREPEGLYYPEWPSKRISQLKYNLSETFHCAAKEEVKFVAVGAGDIPDSVVFQSNKSSKFPYISTFSADLRDFLDFSIIQCQTASDMPKVLHTWTIYKQGHFENRKFYYDEKLSSYVCCKGVFEPPPMEFVPCSSYQECKINKACLADRKCDDINPSSGFAPSYINPKHKSVVSSLNRKGCVTFDTENNPSGLLQCNEEQFFFFLGNFAECDYQCSAFNELKYLPSIKNSDILGITQKPPGPIQLLGKPIRFDCYGPRFQYAGGFKWALIKNNGVMDFIPGSEKEEGALMHSWTEVQFTDKKVESIACIAPEINTLTDWKKSSLAIEYAPDETYS